MTNPYSTLNKVILYTINSYIEQSIKDKLEPSPLHYDLKFATKVYKNANKLDENDRRIIAYIKDDERLKEIVEANVSFLVYTLELIKQFVEKVPKKYRPDLNISDKKLSIGRASYAMAMLDLKQRDTEKYQEVSAIINDSIQTAIKFFDFHVEELVEKESK